MPRHWHPSNLGEIDWSRPSAEERTRRENSWARIKADIDRAAMKMVREIAKRRARDMLANPGQLEMVAEGLSTSTPADMIAKIVQIKRVTRSLRHRRDPLIGRVEAHNLNAALLLARVLRRAEWRQSLLRDAA